MKYIVKRGKFRREKFLKQEPKRLLFRSILRSTLMAPVTKEQVRKGLTGNMRVSSVCNLSGRSRSVYRFFGLSRMKILEMSRNGELAGLRRGMW
jgi:small subunit ribosomal protein S14